MRVNKLPFGEESPGWMRFKPCHHVDLRRSPSAAVSSGRGGVSSRFFKKFRGDSFSEIVLVLSVFVKLRALVNRFDSVSVLVNEFPALVVA